MPKNNSLILPGQTIGIIGGGQLGRMMAIAARYMGYSIVVLDPTCNCPVSQVADKQISAAYDDRHAIKELTDMSDVVTYEFENVDVTAATYIEKKRKLPQGTYPLEITQNREKEKQLMRDLELPIPDFSIVTNGREAAEALKTFSFPAVIKTCSGGYDGKGQMKLHSKADIQQAVDFAEKHTHCIIEEWVSFDTEISVIFTRDQSGGITFFPIAENDHKDHILYQTQVPARISEEAGNKAYKAAEKLAEKMDVVGTFAIEMFVQGEVIFLNEMAPRPHNSGHYTIEACNVSQFTQHIRAICGLPLTPIKLLAPAAMINILGEDQGGVLKALPQVQDGFVHLYGKTEAKSKRKMGHTTFIAETQEEIQRKICRFEEAKR
ncbi:5-(carboxyamino)imidazole ribonucleotide synthase [Virgibacillus sp. NKC19-3]|uniref:5-(carboxyamino)imidazole ribonucleotide synthase n=1 Tax=Virgibacillus saliphilus TaxID=2831674 RepID=UPI001C9A8CC0|nr:5-(carboxyamino)imidazole ribonucleotide synthase [Virgibacillus sp. NKC19-3]MBY7142664.1 5-(carboxyamino)imidazole ribonucleotide synthase [Virgibacillus sp. NKC19-3]